MAHLQCIKVLIGQNFPHKLHQLHHCRNLPYLLMSYPLLHLHLHLALIEKNRLPHSQSGFLPIIMMYMQLLLSKIFRE